MSENNRSLTEAKTPSATDRGALSIRSWHHIWGRRTLVMGIVNVTPDSFSGDGSIDTLTAVENSSRQIMGGCDIVDIGGESTRPGHVPVCAAEELDRVIPVLTQLRQSIPAAIISIDSNKLEVFEQAWKAGVDIANCIWPPDRAFTARLAETGVPVVVMHNKPEPIYEGSVIDEVLSDLDRLAKKLVAAGVLSHHIILDPGIGFGKLAKHNLEVLHSLDRLVALGFPTLLGTSRKSFIGKLTGRDAEHRDYGTAATVAIAVEAGIDIVRVHNVEAAVDAVRVSDAIFRNWRPADWID